MKRITLASFAVVCGVLAALGANAGLDTWTGALHGSRPRLPSKETRSTRTLSKSAEVAMKNGGGTFDAAKAVAARVFDDSEMSAMTWQTAFSSEEERVDVGTLVTAEGLHSSFAVYGQLGNFVPYYWTVSGLAGGNDIPAMLYEVGLADEGSSVYMADGLLSADDMLVLDRGVQVPVPFERFYFAFMDDAPGANWDHPCRYVFVSEDATSFAALYRTRPPQLQSIATSEALRLSPLWKANEEKAEKSLQKVTSEVYSYANGLESNAISYTTGDKSKSYFVLICGGDCPKNNGIRFWSDTAMMYSTLTKKYGVSKSNIYVYMSDGNSNGKDANLGTWDTPMLVDSPHDLDGDGSGDVDGAASSSVVSGAFSSLRSNLTANDQLWVFITSHGGSDGVAGPSNYDCYASLFSSDGSDYFTDDELASWTSGFKCPVSFMIETCYSGGFVDDIRKTANRAIVTACNHNEYSYGSTGNNVEYYWDDVGCTLAYNKLAAPFVAAIRGYMPVPFNGYGYPWSDDYSVNADANGDGFVSFGEASRYAQANDEARCTSSSHPDWCSYYYDSYGNYGNRYEHPQYAESTSGLGDRLFVLKQTQAPATITLQTALDNTSLAFTTGGDVSWLGQASTSHDGVDAAKSGAITHSQTSWMQTTVSGAGTISFWWYVSCEGNDWDYLAVFVDDVEMARICGTGNSWEQKSFSVSSGSHTVKWLYSKDSSNSVGDDAGFVDQVVWTPSGSGDALTIGGKTSLSRAYSCASQGAYFSVKCNSSWTATPSASWIKLVSGSSGSGDGTVAYTLTENTGAKRSGKITVTSGGKTCVCSISQDKQLLIGGKTSLSRTYENAAQSGCYFGVTCSQSPWTAVSSASWITLQSGSSSGTGSGKVCYNIAANTGSSKRTATIKVTSRGLTRTCTITQKPASTLTIGGGKTSMSRTYASPSQTGNFSIQCNTSWTVEKTGSWITVLSDTSGSGNGEVVYFLAANTSSSSRTGKITVKSGSLTRTCTIKQTAD